MQKFWSSYLIMSPQLAGICNEPENPFQVIGIMLPSKPKLISHACFMRNICVSPMCHFICGLTKQSEEILDNGFGPTLL